ncbi:hypothetical protein [Okeania sp.]|uniref:hypothetical protein n=1 Tax=Okeania sp. TaxID=3100323 RepID=UPI002B4B891C|nr:hypothetical protein [Okeania sp.]MEB3343435.1 hypothetical protein [Okeania sp.]
MSNLSYSKFTLENAKINFELTLEENQDLFPKIQPIKPSEILTTILGEYIPLATAINTGKARSELLISQILAEVRRQLNYQISLFSGTEFNVEAELGLQGYCDFLLSFSSAQYFITAPVITIVEAKNENIIRGLGQCVASMVGGQLFNQRCGNSVKVIYGAVTTGTNWKFLTLEEKIVRIDVGEYYVKEIDKILGIILQPFQEYSNSKIEFKS